MTDRRFLIQHSVTAEHATRLIAAVEDSARRRDAPVSIAVVDHGGHLVAFRRMDGAYPGSVDAAIGKARSCAAFRTPLATFGRMARKEPWLGDLPGLIPLGGAVPLWSGEADGSDFVGAASVSGDTEEGEQALAEQAAAAFAAHEWHPPFEHLDDPQMKERHRTGFAQGIEHVGMTVPRIEDGEAFFVTAFGADVLYRVLPKSRGPQTGTEVGAINGLPAERSQVAISMLRIGTGANLELFEVDRTDGPPPDIATPGPTHFSIHVDDLAAAARAVVAAGGTMLAGPQDCFDEETGPGNRLWFCRTPWGSLIELLHLPSPMTYRPGARRTRFIPAGE